MHNKMISNLFEGKDNLCIASPKDASDYWTTLKRRILKEEKSEIPTNCRVLKMRSYKDGKLYKTDALDAEGIFRLIESIPSPKAEPLSYG